MLSTNRFSAIEIEASASEDPQREPEESPMPTKPEVEPEKLPDEDPGIAPQPDRKKEDDDDDDDDYDPFSEPEIGDDPDEIKKSTIIM